MLSIHVLGADAREGTDRHGTAAVFGPLCALLGGSGWRELRLLLCGPNCFAARAADAADDDDDADDDADASLGLACGGAARLRVRYSGAYYHELEASWLSPPPQLAVAFNAGVWGYDSWGPTVRRVLARGSPLLVTAYTLEEAEHDEETIEELGGALAWAWPPQPNPWRATEPERRSGPRRAFENAAWQCVVAGGDGGAAAGGDADQHAAPGDACPLPS